MFALSAGERLSTLIVCPAAPFCSEREFFIDNLLVRIHVIIMMIRWTGLAPERLSTLIVRPAAPFCQGIRQDYTVWSIPHNRLHFFSGG